MLTSENECLSLYRVIDEPLMQKYRGIKDKDKKNK